MSQTSSENSRRFGAWWILPAVLLIGVVPYQIWAETKAGKPVGKEGKKDSSSYTHVGEIYALRAGGQTVTQGDLADPEMNQTLDGNGDVLWFRRGNRSYTIRDAATLQRALEVLDHQRALSQKLSALSQQQTALSREHEDLEFQHAALGREDSALRRQQDQRDYDAEELQKKRSELAGKREGLRTQQAELSKQQAAIGGEELELSRQLDEESKKADDALRGLLDEALRNGTAQEVR